MSTDNQSALVDHKEKKPAVSPRPRRQFGTLLSVNSPTPPRSTTKKGRLFLRSSANKRSPCPEETIDFTKTTTTYTVTFDQGPIGLHLQPCDDGLCRVERFAGERSAALMSGKIEIGDIVHSVNGKRVAYNAAMDILQDTSKRRTITFQRNHRSQVASPSTDSLQTIPLHDPSERSNGESEHPAMEPKRLLGEETSDQLEASAEEKLDALNRRISELEDENNELRMSKKHAIQEMEFNMRMQSLKDENKALRESKAKLKKQMREMDEKRHLSDGGIDRPTSKFETMKGSYNQTTKSKEDIETMKLQVGDLQHQLSRAQAETESKNEQLASMDSQLQKLRKQFDASENDSNETNKRLLESIRSKDLQIHKLAQGLLVTDTNDANSEADVSADRSKLNAALDEMRKAKNLLQERVDDLRGKLASSHQDKKNLQDRITILSGDNETKNRTIEELRSQTNEIQQLHNETVEKGETQIAVLKQENASQRIIMEQLQASVEDMSAQKSQLQQRLRQLQFESTADIERLSKESAALGDKLETITASKQASEKQHSQILESFRAENKNISSKLEDLETESSRLRDEKETVAELLNAARNELKTQIICVATKDRQIADARHCNETLRAERDSLKFEMNQRNELLLITQQLLKDKDCDLKASEQRLLDILQLQVSLSEDVDRLAKERQASLSQLDEKSRLLNEATSLTSHLEDQVRQFEDRHVVTVGSLEGEIMLLKEDTKRLQRQKDLVDEQLAVSMQQRRSIESKAEYAAAQQLSSMRSLEDENMIVKTKWLATTAALKALSTKHEQARRECLRLNEEVEKAEQVSQAFKSQEKSLIERLSNSEGEVGNLVRKNENVINENTKLQNALADKESQLRELSDKMKAASDEVSKGFNLSNQLRVEACDLRSQLSVNKDATDRERVNLEQMLNDAFDRNKILLKESERSKEGYRVVTEKLVQSEKTNSAYMSQIAGYKEHLQTIASEKRELGDHLQELKADLEVRRGREANLQRELQILRGDFETLQEENSELSRNYNKSVDSIKKLQSELSSNKCLHASAVSEFERQLHNANTDLDELRSILEEKSKTAHSNEADLRTEIKSLDAAKLVLRRENSSLQRKNAILTETARQYDSDRDEKDRVIAKFETELFELREKLMSYENENERHVEQMCSMQERIDSSENKRQDAIHNLEKISGLLKESRKKLALEQITHQEESQRLQNRCASILKELLESQQGLKQLEGEMKERDQQMLRQHAMIEDLKEELNHTNTEYSSLSNQRDDFANQLQEQCNRLNKISEEKEIIDGTLRHVRHEFSAYRSKAQETESELYSQLESLKSFLEEEKRQRRVFEADVVRLKDERAKKVFEQSVNEHSEKIRRLNFLIHMKDDQISSLNKECDTNATLIEQLRHRNSELVSKITMLEQNVEEMNLESSATVDECIRQCKKDLTNLEEHSQNEIKILHERLQISSDEKIALEKEVATMSLTIDQYEKAKASLSSELQSQMQQNESLRHQLKESKELAIELHVDRSDSSSETDESVSTSSPFKGFTRQDLKMKCVDLQTDLGQLEDRVEFASHDAGLKSMHLQQVKENLRRMTEEVKSMTLTNEHLERSLRESLTQRQKIQERVTDLEQEKKNLVAEITIVKTEMESLRKDKSEKYKATESSLSESLNLVQDLKMRTTELQSEKSALEVTTQQLTSRFEDLNKDLSCARQRASYLSSQLEKSKVSFSEIQRNRDEVQKELVSCQLSREDLLTQLNERKAELLELRNEQAKMQQDLKVALQSEQDLKRTFRSLEANAVVSAGRLSKVQQSTDLLTEERNQATQELTKMTKVVQDLQAKIMEQHQMIISLQEKNNTLTKEVSELKANASGAGESSRNEYAESLEEKCNRLSKLLETLQNNEREINLQVHEYRRQIASKESCNRSLLSQIECQKTNTKSVRLQLEETRKDMRQLDVQCRKLEMTVVEKQMEIDQLQADLQIAESTLARIRSETVFCEKNLEIPVQVYTGRPESFDPYSSNESEDMSEILSREIFFIDGMLRKVQKRFNALSPTSKNLEIRNGALDDGLEALDLAGLEIRSRPQSILEFSDLLVQIQIDVAQQRNRLRRLGMGPWSESLDSRDKKSGTDMSAVARDFEQQLDNLLVDLQAANKALGEKDKLLERMHEISSCHEAERMQLEATVEDLQGKLRDEQSWKETAKEELCRLREFVETKGEEAPVAACQKASTYLMLQCIEKRTLAAKVVAFRQWACHASAQQAIGRQQQVATVLSEQLQETREKLKILKKHMKKSRRGRLNTIAETSKDDDDASLESCA